MDICYVHIYFQCILAIYTRIFRFGNVLFEIQPTSQISGKGLSTRFQCFRRFGGDAMHRNRIDNGGEASQSSNCLLSPHKVHVYPCGGGVQFRQLNSMVQSHNWRPDPPVLFLNFPELQNNTESSQYRGIVPIAVYLRLCRLQIFLDLHCWLKVGMKL